MTSYRFASALQAAAYLVVCLSLGLKPPGNVTSITTDRGTVMIPAHLTFFQQVDGGSELWLILIGAGAFWLLVTAIIGNIRGLVLTHAYMMTVMSAFGVGYTIGTAELGAGWLTGGIALVAAAGHALALRSHPCAADHALRP